MRKNFKRNLFFPLRNNCSKFSSNIWKLDLQIRIVFFSFYSFFVKIIRFYTEQIVNYTNIYIYTYTPFISAQIFISFHC